MKRNQKGQFIKREHGNFFEGFAVWNDDKGYPKIWIDGKDIRVHLFVWKRAKSAADDMKRAAASISETAIGHQRFMDEWLCRLEEILTANQGS